MQPETDETYAYYGFDTYNDRIGYSLGKVVDMIPEEITSVDEISDHCAQRDSAFYTGGFIAPTQRTEIGGREMLCSEGYITENPELHFWENRTPIIWGIARSKATTPFWYVLWQRELLTMC